MTRHSSGTAGIDEAVVESSYRTAETGPVAFVHASDSALGFSDQALCSVSSENSWRPQFGASEDVIDLSEKVAVSTPKTFRGLIRFAQEHFGYPFGERVSQLRSARPAYGGNRLQRQSLESVLSFLERQEDWRLPDLLLAPNGNVQGQWRSDERRIVAQFLLNGEIWFTVLEQGNARLTGRSTPDEFVSALGRIAPVTA